LLLGIPIFVNILDFSLTVGVSLADLDGELQVLLTEVNRLLPQLNTFLSAVGSFRPIPSFKYKTKLFATFFLGKIL